MKRGQIAVLASLALLAGLGGAHRVLARRGGGCPVGSTPDGRALEDQRARAMSPLAGGRPAPRAAFAPLTDVASFRAAARAAGARCNDESEGAVVRCVIGEGTTTLEERLARLDPAGRLVTVDVVRYGLGPVDASRAFDEIARETRSVCGEPSRTWGEVSPSFLGAPLRQVGVAYRFRDLAVDLTATHLGEGVVVRTQHRVVPARGTEG